MEYISTGAPNLVGQGAGVWCEICRNRGHRHENYHLLQKYQSTIRNLYCNLYRLVGHEQFNCHAWQLMSERMSDVYRVQGEETPKGIASQFPKSRGGYGGYKGRGRGGFGGRRRGQITSYNCG